MTLHEEGEGMEPCADADATCREWFMAKLVNGKVPLIAPDGTRYFVEVVDGIIYWVSERGLLTPPEDEPSSR